MPLRPRTLIRADTDDLFGHRPFRATSFLAVLHRDHGRRWQAWHIPEHQGAKRLLVTEFDGGWQPRFTFVVPPVGACECRFAPSVTPDEQSRWRTWFHRNWGQRFMLAPPVTPRRRGPKSPAPRILIPPVFTKIDREPVWPGYPDPRRLATMLRARPGYDLRRNPDEPHHDDPLYIVQYAGELPAVVVATVYLKPEAPWLTWQPQTKRRHESRPFVVDTLRLFLHNLTHDPRSYLVRP